MQVVDRVEREIEHDNVVHVRHVQPPGSDICANLIQTHPHTTKTGGETSDERGGLSESRVGQFQIPEKTHRLVSVNDSSLRNYDGRKTQFLIHASSASFSAPSPSRSPLKASCLYSYYMPPGHSRVHPRCKEE